ncbi:MAG: SRPBCC family protein [Actinobacteria bacterium]|nr:SRPBCC family protein [Actinomycetota bacterium]
MSNITVIHEIEIAAPADVAWRVVADYARDVEWRAGVISMEPTQAGLVHVGTITAEQMKVAGRTYRNDGEVFTVEPGSRFEWRTTSGAIARGCREVVPVDRGRCRVHLELHVTPTGLNRLLAPMLQRMLGRGLAGDLQRLCTVVEAEAAAPQPRSVPQLRP